MRDASGERGSETGVSGSADVSAGRRGAASVSVASVLDAMPCAAMVVEVGSGRLLMANRAARGDSLEHLVAGDARLGYYASDPSGARLAVDETPVVRAGRGDEFESLRMAWHTSRGAVHYLVSSRIANGIGGGPAAAVVTFLDVTQLEAAQGELRQTLRAREEFIAVVTHELKEPLNAILLSLQLLEAMGEAREILPQLALMRRQGNRLAQLIENLLDVSRAANDVLSLDPEAMDLCELARDVVARFRRDDPLAAETLTLIACEPTIGYFDRVRMEQVLSNLVINAMKYGAGKPVTVAVSVAGADDETARLVVADHGIGIDAADRARVFGRFERATSGHRRSSLGLGLYIVRCIVEAHGGTIDVTSELGRGSTFTVALPRHRLHGRGTG